MALAVGPWLVHELGTILLIERVRGDTQSSQKRSSEPGDDDKRQRQLLPQHHSTATVFKVVHVAIRAKASTHV